jgi:hypothetical protein
MERLRPMRLAKPEAESSRACPRGNVITSLGESSMTSNALHNRARREALRKPSEIRPPRSGWCNCYASFEVLSDCGNCIPPKNSSVSVADTLRKFEIRSLVAR